jgi:hypothetical protein
LLTAFSSTYVDIVASDSFSSPCRELAIEHQATSFAASEIARRDDKHLGVLGFRVCHYGLP